MRIKERFEFCENSINETFQQIKELQNRHQQLIGYRQALVDVLNDQEAEEKETALAAATESIAQDKKKKTAA